MKNKFLNKLIAIGIISVSVSALAGVSANAAWISNFNGGWAYSNGYGIYTGWHKISGVWYYFNSFGRMQTGWLYDGGNWYYLNANGEMQTGVIQVEGKIYLLNESGAMQTGPVVINDIMYNFGPDGSCTNTNYPMPSKAYDYYGTSVVPYGPTQVISPNATMSSEIPSDGTETEKRYKITFKDDDGERLSVRSYDADEKAKLYEPTKSGYTFIEWNSKKNGNGKSYDADDKINLTEDITLYAQWDEKDDE